MTRWRTLACAALLTAAASAHAQGCAQCRDNLQETPPSVQAAYRHAIELLAGCGVAVFTAGVVMLRRYR